MLGYLYILIAFLVILAIGPVAICIEKAIHWFRRKWGVTELTKKQRQRQALRYKETTGRQGTAKKRRSRRKTRSIR